ncbi:30S ribosome-binding factor RbfA [Candidatus Albibeggiatoa sp. nov. BB20]|uniref:30S ribosome-binding factor RbfA n=1 Tax=Candidatus Albibeggiatoa sp. nov. BB20 TaxID=3162723 RepID=UPI003365932A
MPKEFKRNTRINGLVQKELSDIIQRELETKQLGMLTISEVNTSPDLKNAMVYFTCFGGELDEQNTLKYLTQKASMLRHHLSQRINNIRTVPRLQFKYDASVVEGSRLSALIDSVVPKEDEDNGEKA